MQTCKPGSVFRHWRNPYHLSGPVITGGINQPTRFAILPEVAEVWTSSPWFYHQRNLFGLSTRKVYRAPDVTTRAVGPYPTFSPLPSEASAKEGFTPPSTPATPEGSLFSVALSVCEKA